MNNCNCGCYQEILPDCDMRRWEVSPSVQQDCCCIKARVVGHTLYLDGDCVYVVGHTLYITE